MAENLSKSSSKKDPLSELSLGKNVEYCDHYAPNLLQPVPRTLSRREIGLGSNLPFHGEDLWTAYELSWLNNKNKPQVAIMECTVPHDSPNLIESKSFKMYLNSFNQTNVASYQVLESMLQRDLSACADKDVSVNIVMPNQFSKLGIRDLDGECIDDLDIEIDSFELTPEVLKSTDHDVSETLTSNLLKSNCLITNQPDWASVAIKYQGPKVDRESLLRYLISFRMHNEFHEQCVERIFCDIKRFCNPRKLSVYARYTRRGGLDINPFRSDFEHQYPRDRQARQ